MIERTWIKSPDPIPKLLQHERGLWARALSSRFRPFKVQGLVQKTCNSGGIEYILQDKKKLHKCADDYDLHYIWYLSLKSGINVLCRTTYTVVFHQFKLPCIKSFKPQKHGLNWLNNTVVSMSNSLVENQNYFQKKETKRSRKQIAEQYYYRDSFNTLKWHLPDQEIQL